MLVVGTKTNDLNKLVKIDYAGLCHHTLVVGQSGGGKSFLVARIVEEILLRSKARVLIIDPNGDFRQISKPNPKSWEVFSDIFNKIDHTCSKEGVNSFDTADKFSLGWKKRRFTYLAPQRGKGPPNQGDITDKLIVHWDTLEDDQRAFLLNADVRVDPKIYMGLKAVSENTRWVSKNRPDVGIGYNLRGMRDVCGQFALSNLSMREYEYAKLLTAEDWSAVRATLEDLLTRYSVWWSALPSQKSRPLGLSDYVDGAFLGRKTLRTYWDSLILSLDSATQSDTLLAADVALSRSWLKAKQVWRDAADKHEGNQSDDARVPTFIVVDEAHNFAPERTDDPLRVKVTQKLLQIASEGRKYGIYLILATQRPTKLHRELVPECENACVLRLQSTIETNFASDVLGLSDKDKTQVPGFTLGQGVFFGRWVGGTEQLNAKVAPARIQVGGGGLPETWRDFPDSTPEINTEEAQFSEFISEILENSSEPVDLAALASEFRSSFGGGGADGWFGHSSFKEFLLSLNLENLDISSIPPGYAYFKGVHEEPKADVGVLQAYGLSQTDSDALALAHRYLQAPIVAKEKLKVLFEQLSIEVLANSFNLTDTSRNVRDRCQSVGAQVGRSVVNYVLKGLHFAGHIYDPDVDQSPKILAETFAYSLINALEKKGVAIDPNMRHKILDFYSGGLAEISDDSIGK